MRASLRLIRREGWRRVKLAGLVTRFRRGASQLGLPLSDSNTAIQPLVLGDNGSALAYRPPGSMLAPTRSQRVSA